MRNRHFIIIGAQRSGSTLYSGLLNKSSSITMAMPTRPEPKYFLNNQSKTYKSYRSSFWPNDLEENQWLGEKSTSYYESTYAANAIYQTIPDCKILTILRNPIKRAISNYFFTKSYGIEPRSIEDVFLNNKPSPLPPKNISVNPYDYLKRGCYGSLLESYSSQFSKQSMHLLLLEELINNPSIINGTLKFLEIENQAPIIFDVDKKVNSGSPDNVPIEVIHRLQDYYYEPNKKLEKAWDIDLSYWKENSQV